LFKRKNDAEKIVSSLSAVSAVNWQPELNSPAVVVGKWVGIKQRSD